MKSISTTQPFFSKKLADDVKLSIVGGVGHWGSQKVAFVSRDFKETVKRARELRMYGVSESVKKVGVCDVRYM